MGEQTTRRRQVLKLTAETAFKLPRLDSGFWFHQDMRDNLYYAMHLFAASTDRTLDTEFRKEEGLQLGIEMLHAVLKLQVKDPGDAMYGHFPLGLNPDPWTAPAHTLPVELLGSLIAWYYNEYSGAMDSGLRLAFEEAMRHAYLGNYYRKPAEQFNHHESKYTSQQLIWGELFQDGELLAEGKRNLKLLLDTVKANGMREYGALPWFWHWVQSFSAARALLKDSEGLRLLDEMLNYLWKVRASAYLKGAWTAPHSRVLPHDMPADRSNLIDYIQFGDFELSSSISRLEAAGLIHMEPSDESITLAAVNRTGHMEVKRLIPLNPVRVEEGCLHGCTYITPDYAVGGVWERAEEYLNEQHRWDVTLPARADGSGNKVFFFRPGGGYSEGDPRHQSGSCQVLLHRNTAAALFPVPGEDAAGETVEGVLPHGQWRCGKRLIAGQTGSVYVVIHLMNEYTVKEGTDYIAVRSAGGRNGVAVEVLDAKTAAALGLASLTAVMDKALDGAEAGLFRETDSGGIHMAYTSLADGARLELEVGADGAVSDRRINGKPVSFEDYKVEL